MSAPARLAARLGIKHPIILAPMAGISTPELAAAVSNAGGLGSLGIAASSPAAAREEITRTRLLTPHPFSANVFCHAPAIRDSVRERAWLQHLSPLFTELGSDTPSPDQLSEPYPSFLSDGDAMLRVLLDHAPPIVSFHFGLPTPSQLKAIKNRGLTTLAAVTSPSEAAAAATAGVDVIVAQGAEAGGHRGVFDPYPGRDDPYLSTESLVKALVKDGITLPIVAAGGIMTGAHARKALEWGAAGVQLGTAFLLCPEAATGAEHRKSLKDLAARHAKGEKKAQFNAAMREMGGTVVTDAISGRPARGFPTVVAVKGAEAGAPQPAAYPVAYDAAKKLAAAASKKGKEGYAVQWAGAAAGMVREMGAGEIVAQIVKEMGEAGR